MNALASAATPRPAASAAPAATGNGADQEFSFSQADFERVRALIYQRAGISLHAGKQAMVYSRLSRRLRETGHRSFHDYLSWLQGQDGQEWQEFVNALTTNLTSFFREGHHFEILHEHLQSKSKGQRWNIWCSVLPSAPAWSAARTASFI